MSRLLLSTTSHLPMVFVLTALVTAACSASYAEDPNDQCSSLEHYDSTTHTCVCPVGHVLQDGTCRPCAANEVANDNMCVCAEGYVRDDASGSCQPVAQTASTGDGSNTAATSAGSNTAATSTALSGPPAQTGVDTPCKSDADCAGFDANFCELLVSKTCLVKNCDPAGRNQCSEGHHCCDFANYGLPSLCISAALSGGVCTQ